MPGTTRAYEIDASLARFDFARVHAWLKTAYWSVDITRAEVERGFGHSTLVVGAYGATGQVGCLRVVSDRTRFAYIMDAFVEEGQRGGGIARAMVRFALEHPDLAPVYQWRLATDDAHGVYAKLGFTRITDEERWMVLARPRAWLNE